VCAAATGKERSPIVGQTAVMVHTTMVLMAKFTRQMLQKSAPETGVINSMPYSGMCVTPSGVIFLPLAVSGVEENTENQHEQTALIGRRTVSCKLAHI